MSPWQNSIIILNKNYTTDTLEVVLEKSPILILFIIKSLLCPLLNKGFPTFPLHYIAWAKRRNVFANI